MKPEDLKQLGFEFESEYNHDGFHTKRYVNGDLIVELTYERDLFVTSELFTNDSIDIPITLEELKAITPILTGKTHN